MEFNSQTAVAFIRLIVALAASVCATFGWVLDIELWANIGISVIAVILFIYSWWKNNNITEAAQAAQDVLNEIKQAQRDGEEIEVIVQDVENEYCE